jgi:hypothetical protein
MAGVIRGVMPMSDTLDFSIPSRMYRVVDPYSRYPIHAVEVLAADTDQAKERALEAMTGCRIDDEDEESVREALDGLIATEMPRQQ